MWISILQNRTEEKKRHSSLLLFAETERGGLPVWGKWLSLKPLID